MSETDQIEVSKKLSFVRLLAMDIDGVLTDGGLLFTSDESENKRFHVADGLGLQLVMIAGISVAWISGRKSAVVEKRAAELGVTHLYQGISNKATVLAELMVAYTLTPASIAYIGDDLNDIPAFAIAGAKFAPANAVLDIKALADFVTEHRGGDGAVREVCDTILRAQDKYTEAVTGYLAHIVKP